MAKRAAASPSLLNLANVITGGGGLPVFAGKDIVGSIGVSGAPGRAVRLRHLLVIHEIFPQPVANC